MDFKIHITIIQITEYSGLGKEGNKDWSECMLT